MATIRWLLSLLLYLVWVAPGHRRVRAGRKRTPVPWLEFLVCENWSAHEIYLLLHVVQYYGYIIQWGGIRIEMVSWLCGAEGVVCVCVCGLDAVGRPISVILISLAVMAARVPLRDDCVLLCAPGPRTSLPYSGYRRMDVRLTLRQAPVHQRKDGISDHGADEVQKGAGWASNIRAPTLLGPANCHFERPILAHHSPLFPSRPARQLAKGTASKRKKAATRLHRSASHRTARLCCEGCLRLCLRLRSATTWSPGRRPAQASTSLPTPATGHSPSLT
ncbi:predicted protein [Plenodomus lingam JN3]|uniref:Predicted protein n=1 Tax=Leptosphaeria maculans (strain JN3 / isolate v23.1.3 / race Av1-4-5-6-7-8) TaxID=985895 RepID=E5A3D9_LEPMJ|nr:predicted protein [Plenodomus lingam JN3]CBX98152.1 predicted protein [Plenodomus lingam JN3]